MKTTLKGLLFLAALLVLAVSTAQAAIDPATAHKLLAEDGAADDRFGSHVAVDGDTAFIGAIYDDDKGIYAGAVYVFIRAADGTWSQKAKLTAEDGAGGERFGSSIAVSGNTAVIGANLDNDNGTGSGSAYVFGRAADGTWSQKAKLLAEDGTTEDWFGSSVAMSGDTAVIGAHGDDDKGSPLEGGSSGAAYVFVRAADGTWSQKAKLLAEDGAEADGFGASVAVVGGTAIIGACGDDDKGNYSGSAYVFGRAADGTWSQKAKLFAEDAAAGDGFGSVAMSGDIAVIGADSDSDNGLGSGSAYVFVRATDGTWSQKAKLLAADGTANDRFGVNVAVSGGTAVIGAHLDDDKGSASGSAYVFGQAADGTWSQQAKLIAEDGAESDMFGISVAVSGGTAVVGAYWDNDKGAKSGSAYVFSGSTPPVTLQGAAQSAVNFLLHK